MSKTKPLTDRKAGMSLSMLKRIPIALFGRGSIRARLLIGFGLMAALIVAVAGTGIFFVNSSAATADAVINEQFPRTQALSEVAQKVLLFEVEADQTVMSAHEGNAGRIPDHLKRLDAAAADVDRALAALKNGDPEMGVVADDDPACQQSLAELTQAWAELHVVTHLWLEAAIQDAGIVVPVNKEEMPEGVVVDGEVTLDTLEIRREKVTKLAGELADEFAADVAGAVGDVEKTQARANTLSVIAALAGLVLATAIGVGISASISGPLGRAVRYARAVADGDLDAQIDAHTEDEVGTLSRSVEAMKTALVGRMEQMRLVASAVTQAAGEVAVAAEQIAATTSQLHAGADTQSAATEETSASIEQMAASIEQVASNAQSLGGAADETSATISEMSASIEQIARSMDLLSTAVSDTSSSVEEMISSIDEVARSSSEVAASGEEALLAVDEGARAVENIAGTAINITRAIENAAAVMRSLGERTLEIGEITETIDDIAEQTNLLALNAAIEAARAGEHGRGFAVVAEAVRDLASRAADSTREISRLIESIRSDTEQAVAVTLAGVEQAAGTTDLATDARSAIDNVKNTFLSVASAMEQIKAATAEQAQGGKRVLHAVGEMNELQRQVDIAIKEQATGSIRIVNAVSDMSARVLQVTNATSEQKRGGEQMVIAMENISNITRQNVNALSGLAESAARLAEQSERLNTLVGDFDLG